MKKIGLLSLIFCFLTYAQPWYYNFGTSTGSHTSGVSTIFLPALPSGGGTARVRIGTGSGSFNLENQSIAFGSESYLRGVAPTGGSVNKFSVYDYANPSEQFTLRFTIRFGASDGSATGAASGTWYLFVGDGPCFSDNNGFTGAQVFTGLRFAFGTGGTITTSARVGGAWTATGTPFAQGNNYIVDIYGNNSSSAVNYNYNGSQSVASNTMDIWVNGVLIADNIGKAQLTDNSDIDSWMFYGENSGSNVANIFLDDIYYTNLISPEPLPVELTSFSATVIGKNVKLVWNTATEINNYGFEIERKQIIKQQSTKNNWEKIGFVFGNGNSSSPKSYSFIDDKTNSGTYSYRLKQVDNDGQFEYSKTVEVNVSGTKEFELSQNYPNPFNPATTIKYTLPQAGNVKLTLYNMLGQEIKVLVNEMQEAGTHTIKLNASDLKSGVYVYKIENGSFIQTRKMTLVK